MQISNTTVTSAHKHSRTQRENLKISYIHVTNYKNTKMHISIYWYWYQRINDAQTANSRTSSISKYRIQNCKQLVLPSLSTSQRSHWEEATCRARRAITGHLSVPPPAVGCVGCLECVAPSPASSSWMTVSHPKRRRRCQRPSPRVPLEHPLLAAKCPYLVAWPDTPTQTVLEGLSADGMARAPISWGFCDLVLPSLATQAASVLPCFARTSSSQLRLGKVYFGFLSHHVASQAL